MTEKKAIYRCSICGNVVEVLDTGAGEIVCCGQAMEKFEEKTTKQEGNEKHVPVNVIGDYGENVKYIKVGEVVHPMEKEHYIEWIELIADGRSIRVFLEPGQKPEAKFRINIKHEYTVRCYCNVHGLWKNDYKILIDDRMLDLDYKPEYF